MGKSMICHKCGKEYSRHKSHFEAHIRQCAGSTPFGGGVNGAKAAHHLFAEHVTVTPGGVGISPEVHNELTAIYQHAGKKMDLPIIVFDEETYCNTCGCQYETLEDNSMVCVEEGCSKAVQNSDTIETFNGATFVNGIHAAKLAPARAVRPADTETTPPLQTTDEVAARIEQQPILPKETLGKQTKKKKTIKIDMSASRRKATQNK